VLDLPRGFGYRVISRKGRKMDDGFVVPALPDGMAAFEGPDGLTVLVCNHELTPTQSGPFGKKNVLFDRIDHTKVYDDGLGKTPSCGGTTTLVYDTKKQKLVRQYLSLAGTVRNCAGGPTPWGSWITCEETVFRAGRLDEQDITFARDHGYNFEVPASAEIGLAAPVPLKAMGRFNHEAVAVHPDTSIVYQTEDRDDGLIYRFIPNTPQQLSKGGRLQALAVAGRPSLDTRNWHESSVRVGETMKVAWQDVDEIDAPKDDLRQRGFKAGAARFARGEGMWYTTDGIYFACTTGGPKKFGQIWKYTPSRLEGETGETGEAGTLTLFVESLDSDLMQNADNMTAAPWGDLIVCEDHAGKENRLIGVTRDGALYTLASTQTKSEFAGATFSPDGSTLFVNLQGVGVTLGITGPWLKS